jgi:glycosyltransferase involved in cell wall biosynthesis
MHPPREFLDPPLVTICVPTIGRAYVLETLDSAIKQTYANVEILVLDNASPPDTQSSLASFIERHPGVRVLRVDERVPMFVNFNRGLQAASGHYITYFHDDDIYLPDFLTASTQLLDEHPEVALVGSNCGVVDETGRLIRKRVPIRRTGVMPRRAFVAHHISSNRNLLPTPGVLFRRDALLAQPFDPTLSVHFGDFVVLMRLAEHGGAGMIRDMLWLQRIHSEMTTGAGTFSKDAPARLEMMQNYSQEYLERWPDDADLIHSLRRGLMGSVRIGLVWGWMAAASDDESAACVTQLSKVGSAPWLAATLNRLDRLGLTRSRRRALIPLARTVGASLRL